MPWSNPDPPVETVESIASDRAADARQQLIAGLNKIGLATRQRAWAGGERRGLTPTQGQALIALHQRGPDGARVTELAHTLGITQATASVAIRALVEKGLVERQPSVDDARATTLTLTATGRDEALQALSWTDFLVESIDELTEDEQTAFQRSIHKMIRSMQQKGQIPVSRMCATCTWFRPNAHPGTDQPHHCAYIDAPFGDRQLRIDCPDFEAASAEFARSAWERFVTPVE